MDPFADTLGAITLLLLGGAIAYAALPKPVTNPTVDALINGQHTLRRSPPAFCHHLTQLSTGKLSRLLCSFRGWFPAADPFLFLQLWNSTRGGWLKKLNPFRDQTRGKRSIHGIVHPHGLSHHHVVQAAQPSALAKDMPAISLCRWMMREVDGLVEPGVLLVEPSEIQTRRPMAEFEVQATKRR